MNKNQYHKHINNVNNYNNNYNYYNNNNYYNGYNYKKQYPKNNTNNMNNNMNNYNEDRKKNNYYNNNYNNNNYNDNNNDYIYNQQTKKKKQQYRYNNNINNNNNYYENRNEEIVNKTLNEKKDKIELLRIQINLKDNQCKDLIVYKDDDINLVVKKFCYEININENLIEPLINKIKQSLNKLNIVYKCVELDKDGVVMLEKAKTLLKNK